MSVELESPVVVLPRAANSSQVLVAHLGRMSLANKPGPPSRTTYRCRLRDISLATVSALYRNSSFVYRYHHSVPFAGYSGSFISSCYSSSNHLLSSQLNRLVSTYSSRLFSSCSPLLHALHFFITLHLSSWFFISFCGTRKWVSSELISLEERNLAG